MMNYRLNGINLKRDIKEIKRVYQYRFIPDNTKVYFISKGEQKKHIKPQLFQFYTEPYYNKEQSEIENSLLCFTNENIALIRYNELSNYHNNCILSSGSLSELKYYSLLLRVPLILEVNSYCDIQELTEKIDIYYYRKKCYSISDKDFFTI